MTPNDRYMTADERNVLSTRRHYTILLAPTFHALGAIFAVVIVGVLLSRYLPSVASSLWVNVLGALVVAPFVLRLLWKILLWWVDEIVVTDKRVFEVSGLIIRKVAMMPLTRITDLTYKQSVLGRMLGYGEMILESAGQDQALSSITHLPEPDEFYRTITRLSLR
jgi:uncharacterized membrane protein YdbT with pleckstrin-like domain